MRSERHPGATPKVLFVTSALDEVGGIPSYSRAVIDALSLAADVEVLELRLSGSWSDHLREFLRAMRGLARRRPDLVVLGHVGLGPIGLAWRALGGRYTVLAYGIEVWGPPSWLVYESLRRAHAVWPISTWTRTEVLRSAPGAVTGPPLGGNIREPFFQPHEAVEGPFRILFVANLCDLAYKGIDTLVEAAQELAQEHPIDVRIAGSGEATNDLRALLVRDDPSGVVQLLGRIDEDALLREYRRADVVVLVSRFRRGDDPQGEGLGLVPLEASAAGTPAIVGSRGGSVDTVVDGETGFIVEAGAADELAGRIRRLLEDPDEARRLGRSARDFVRSEHSFEQFSIRVRAGLDSALR